MSSHGEELVTVPQLALMKQQGRKIAVMTAYDVTFARLMDDVGMDAVLVGDSLGMVIQGQKTTLPVTLAEMIYHTTCVARGIRRALLIADMPFLTFQGTAARALECAGALLAAGAQMVKAEGAGPLTENVRYLCERGIPVCGHIGLTPQFVNTLGGFKVQGRGGQGAQLKAQAQELAEAGASALLLEAVPAPLASEITQSIAIPTIGIGAGPGCDGQVLVMHDALGLGARRPRFVRDFLGTGGSIESALRSYVEAVHAATFPSDAESYHA